MHFDEPGRGHGNIQGHPDSAKGPTRPERALHEGLSRPSGGDDAAGILPPPPPPESGHAHAATDAQAVALMALNQIRAGDPWTTRRIGAHDMTHGLSDGNVRLHIPCSPGRIFVDVTYHKGSDTYFVEGYKMQRGSMDRIPAYALEGVYAEDLARIVEKAYEQALKATTERKPAVDPRSGWLKDLVAGDMVMAGWISRGRLEAPATFEICAIKRVTPSGRLVADNGSTYGPDGVSTGGERGMSGLIPLRSLVLDARSTNEIQKELLAAGERDRKSLSVGGCHQVGIALLPPSPGSVLDPSSQRLPVMRRTGGSREADELFVVSGAGANATEMPFAHLPEGTNIAVCPK